MSTLLSSSTDRNPLASSTSSITRQHIIFDSEYRVVLDIGSLYVKCGFSGESRPRQVIPVFASSDRSHDGEGEAYITPGEFKELFDHRTITNEKELETLEDNLNRILHDIFFGYLLTDPKQRKVIICESPLVPIRLKQIIANVLFQNFQVPSISFVPTHLLALLTAGTTTGLVVDCGNLETIVLPIYSSRPLTPFIRTSPLAGRALAQRLRTLLLKHGRLILPSNLPRDEAPQTPIPEALLTPKLLEDIKTRFIVVSPVMIADRSQQSEAKTSEDDIEDKYKNSSSATDIYYSVRVIESSQIGQHNNVMGKILIPGWIRERAAEVLFEGDDDEASVPGCILDSVAKIQTDLRRPLISSILLIGGTSMLPGFKQRVEQEILRTLREPTDNERKRYMRTLKGAADYVSFLGDPNRPSGPGAGNVFMNNIRGWIGGSLLGSIRSSGPELVKEKFSGQVPDWSLSVQIDSQGPST